MSILFAHSFFIHFDEKQEFVKEPYPPMETLIAAAAARERGHKISLFDATLAPDIRAFPKLMSSELIEMVVFYEDGFNNISRMCLRRMREACLAMIQFANEAGVPVVVAGMDATDHPEPYFEAGARYVLKGRNMTPLLQLLEHHGNGVEALYQGPGVYYLENGEVKGRPYFGDVAKEPFPKPAWDLVNVDAYKGAWSRQHNYYVLSMVTTMGCPYRCNWCVKPLMGKDFRVRDPLDAAREMRDLKKRYKPGRIWFADDIFGLEPGWIQAFAAEVVRLDASIPFKVQARADLITPATAQALARAGCREVWMGVESGSQKILDAMDKELAVEQIHEAVRRLTVEGIHACFFLQFGYPGEDASDIRATWDMIEQTRPYNIGLSLAYPQQGTPFHEKVKDSLLGGDHWERSRFLKPVFETTYPADLYPVLFQYIRQLFHRMNTPKGLGPRRFRAAIHRAATRRRLGAFGIEGLPFT